MIKQSTNNYPLKGLLHRHIPLVILIVQALLLTGCARYRPALLISYTKEGADIEVKKLGKGASPSWSPDGKRIAYQNNGIWLIDLESKRRTKISRAGANPSWSPDGNRIAYVYNGIWLWEEGTGTHRLVSNRGDHPCWLQDGKNLAYSDKGIWQMDVEGGNLKKVMDAGIPLGFSPDGLLMLMELWQPDQLTFYLAIYDIPTAQTRRIADGTKGSFSPDAQSLVFAKDGIWIYSAITKDITRVTMDGYDPRWSPAGDTIVFASRGKLWQVDAPYKAIPIKERQR